MLLVLAGGFGWMARSSATQRFRNAEAVAALLDQCEDALRADRADRAAISLEAAERRAAERRAADGGADDLAGRLARCRADLRLLRELDAIDTFRWTWTQDESPDPDEVVARWRSALDAYGVTADVDPPTDTAKRVNESLIRDRVLTILDLWLALAEPSAWVRAVLRSADPDPYRDAVRDAFAATDDRALSALARRPEALAQPARFAAVLSLGQLREWVTPERQRAVLASALRSRPGDLALLMELGNSYPAFGLKGLGSSREEICERVRWFQAAVAAHPNNVAARSNLGTTLYDRGDLDAALTNDQEAIRLDPTFARGHYNMGVVLRDKGQPEAARAAFLEAVRLYPKFAPSHYEIARALHAAGRTDEALDAYRRAIEADPTYHLAHNNIGVILFHVNRDYDGAVTHFRKASGHAPSNAMYRSNLGNALREKKDLDGAVKAYEESIGLAPKHAPGHYGVGLCLLDQGNTDGAIASFRKAIQADPDYFNAHFHLGQALLAMKHDLDGAITHFNEAVRLRPNDAESHCNLGVARALKGDFDGAVKAYRAAKQHAPKAPDIYSNLALALSGLKDYDGVVKELRALLEITPRDARAHNSLGVALKHKGDVNGALTAFRDAIEINQNHSHPHTNLAWMLATGPDRVRDGKAAVRHATRACELTVWKDADSISTLAAAHAEAGDFDKAVEYQRKALTLPEYQQKALTLPEFEKAVGKGGRERLDLYARKMPYRDPALTPMKE
jgi:tetratricopeptide (TPR) repeat protein